MSYHFDRHYTRSEARELLPRITAWLRELQRLQQEIDTFETRMAAPLAAGSEMGGTSVNAWVRSLAAIQETLAEFHKRRIQLKDLERGLVDFPALIGGKEVFLCWELGEPDIEFWHDLESGYGGRTRLS